MATYTPNAVGSAGNDPTIPTAVILNAATTNPEILDLKGNPTAQTSDTNSRISDDSVTTSVVLAGSVLTCRS